MITSRNTAYYTISYIMLPTYLLKFLPLVYKDERSVKQFCTCSVTKKASKIRKEC